MAWYAFVGVFACISKTEVSWNSSLSSFIQHTLIFSMLFQLKKKKAMLLQITELISQAIHDSISLQFGEKKKRVEAGLLLCFGEIYPLWFVAKGLAGRTWDSQLPFGQVGQKVTNYTFPLNTPKLSEFQRKCLLTSFSRFCSAGNGKFMRPRIDLRRASLVV